MVFTTLTLTLHNIDDPIVIQDYVDDAGKFVAIGTHATAAYLRGEQIHYKDADGYEIIIPYEAIVASSITREEDEYTKPEDAFCTVPECLQDDTCSTSWTITFANGEEKLAEEIVKNGETPVYNGTTPTKTEEGYTCEFIGWNTTADAETALEELPPATETATYYAIFTCTPVEP